MAVANGKVYLLANRPGLQGCMEVFELDLQDWQWRLLPCRGSAPPCLASASISPAVVQVGVV